MSFESHFPSRAAHLMTTAMSLSPRLSLFILTFSLFALASAQFQFFNGMFGHPQQQQQQPSGSQQWAIHADSSTCRCPHSSCSSNNQVILAYIYDSSLFGVSLPRYSRVRAYAHRLPVSECGGHQVRCAGLAGRREWNAALRTRGNRLRSCRKACEEVCSVTDKRPTAPPSLPSPARE